MSTSNKAAVPYPSAELFDVQTEEIVDMTFYALLSIEGVEFKESSGETREGQTNLVSEALVWGCKQELQSNLSRYSIGTDIDHLFITPSALDESYHKYVNKLFQRGRTWERLLVLFAFSSLLAARLYYSGLPDQVESVKLWLLGFIVGSLKDWILRRYGWGSAVEALRHHQGPGFGVRRSNRPWWFHSAVYGVSTGVLMGRNGDNWIN